MNTWYDSAPSAPNVPGVGHDEQRSRGSQCDDPRSQASMAAPLRVQPGLALHALSQESAP